MEGPLLRSRNPGGPWQPATVFLDCATACGRLHPGYEALITRPFGMLLAGNEGKLYASNWNRPA